MVRRSCYMPVYEFRCLKCKKKFDVVKSIAEMGKAKIKCQKCKSGSVERIWSSVYAVTSKKS